MANNSSPQVMSTVQLISRQESTIRNREKDTRLYHSKLELREEAHKEVHKETHLGRAKESQSHSFLVRYGHCPQKQTSPTAFTVHARLLRTHTCVINQQWVDGLSLVTLALQRPCSSPAPLPTKELKNGVQL